MIADNHYVQRAYLARFASSGRVYRYRSLVEHKNVALWRHNSPSGLAYVKHLYTRVDSGSEDDELEKWLAREIEQPAMETIDKVINGTRLSPEDWSSIIRYLAAQDLRTPAAYSRSLQAHAGIVPGVIRRSLEEVKKALVDGTANVADEDSIRKGDAGSDYPIHVFSRNNVDGTLDIQASVLGGRRLWLLEIYRMLTSTWQILKTHRWTILRAPEGVRWFTSDNPVIKLHMQADGRHTFGGGWNSRSTEIFMPLAPGHLLYTRIGHKPPVRGYTLAPHVASQICEIIAANAHREIYADWPVPGITSLRRRIVDPELCKTEQEAMRDFHKSQTDAELDFLTRPDS